MSASSREEAVAYLLDELDEPARTRFETRLAGDGRLRAELEGLRGVVVRLDRMDAATWSPLDPPPPPTVAPAPALQGRSRSRSRRLALPGWGIAAIACGLVGLAVMIGVSLDADGPAIALEPVGVNDGDASGRVRLTEGEAVVRVEGLPTTADGDFYELWLLTTPTNLVSLGSFRVTGSGDAELRVPVPVDPRRFRYLDVSLEPGDGDPGHSQRSVLRAATAG